MVRYLRAQIEKDLDEKMVFVGGPRQVGKTTLAKTFLKMGSLGYLNWDVEEDRSQIIERRWPASRLWVFDEIHKYRRWRNLLKGLYDKYHEHVKVLVTGSARLDYYRFGGDSLQGRYHYLRMHPLSVAELKIKHSSEFEDLTELGGFPEPFFSGSKTKSQRWAREYRQRLVREDIRELENFHDLATIELLAQRLPNLVGSPLSVNALREDLQVSHKSVQKWLRTLESMYHIFVVPPFGSPRIRAVKKAFKHYHLNWALIENEDYRFENLIAAHLLKYQHFIEDTQGIDTELRYFRDQDEREVDFVMIENQKPVLFVECKRTEFSPDPNLKYLKSKFPEVRAIQLVNAQRPRRITEQGIEVIWAPEFLRTLV